jgi:UDP-glucose 4-epimerase
MLARRILEMRNKILITGAAGFIGGALIEFLASQKDVSVIPVTREEGYDLSEPGWVKKIPDGHVNTVIHLAQSSFYRDFPGGASDMRRVNIDATAELLEWSRLNGVKRFLFSSTGNVYKASVQPLIESDPTLPVSFYGATKLCAEQLVTQYSQFFTTINMRLFGVYGPGQKRMLISDIISSLRNGSEITLAQGKGLIFTPIYLADCVAIIHSLIGYNVDETDMTINVAGNENVDLNKVVHSLGRLLDVSPNISLVDGNPKYLVSNIDKLKAVFPRQSFTNINAGLGNCI